MPQKMENAGNFLHIPDEILSFIAAKAFDRVSFTVTRNHLEHLVSVANTVDNSFNDRLVASMLIQNAIISAKGIYPLCQDTGTAQVFAWKEGMVLTEGDDTESLSRGIEETFTTRNLRFSTTIPSSLFEESDPRNNMPAQIMISSNQGAHNEGAAYRFLFCAKGGGSSNKTSFTQGTKALLNEKAFTEFLHKQISSLGTAACPPYTIAVVVGGLSPEQNLLALKLATAGYFDAELPDWDYRVLGTKPIRDREWEKTVCVLAENTGLGAQFGGRSFAVDARVLRLSRHGASCPVSVGVSCAAHRNLHGYIDRTGVYLERTISDPLSIPGLAEGAAFSGTALSVTALSGTAPQKPVSIDLDAGLTKVRALLSGMKTGTPILLSGKFLVARDAAHARWHALLASGQSLPEYTRKYAILYAGPAETPSGCVSGSFGPTTAGRMDEYGEELMRSGAALVTLAKGNRSEQWRKSCLAYGGTYLGTVGGAAALIADTYITESSILDYSDLGMEAVRLVTMKGLPAFVLINDRGEDFYQSLSEAHTCP